MMKLGPKEPVLTPSHIAASIIAAIVLTAFIYLFAGGVFLLLSWPRLPHVAGGLVLLLAALATRPRLRKKPGKDLFSRSELPNLFTLVDKISDCLGTSKPHSLIVNHEPNAYYTNFGFIRLDHKVIMIGLPLAHMLDDQEMIAVLAHEVSHGANGDVSRTRIVWSALEILDQWTYATTPQSITEGSSETAFGSLATIPGNFALLGISLIPRSIANLLFRLLRRDSQRAEYMADIIATKAAGSEAMASALQKLQTYPAFIYSIALKVAESGHKMTFFEKLSSEKPHPSNHELEQLRRLEEIRGLSFDGTHPPLEYRIRFVREHGQRSALVALTKQESENLRAEIRRLQPKIEEKVLDEQRELIF